MILYCSEDVQRWLGGRFSLTQVPTDLLDGWYLHFPRHSPDPIMVTLPGIRFTVLLWDIPRDQRDNLGKRIVQRIRETLQYYHVPQDIIDGYIPEDTVLKLCKGAPRSLSAKMQSVSNQVADRLSAGCNGDDYQRIQNDVNRYAYISPKKEFYDAPALVMQRLLHVPKPLPPALELEVSLDLGTHQVSRTLIVPTSTTFYTLHLYLQEAFRWQQCRHYLFILDPRSGRRTKLHVLSDALQFLYLDTYERADKETYLGDYLQVGETFRYLPGVWTLSILVRDYTLSCPLPMPVCTCCEGTAPPEDVGGKDGYQKFEEVLQDPSNPEYANMRELAGEDWPQQDTPEDISRRIRSIAQSAS